MKKVLSVLILAAVLVMPAMLSAGGGSQASGTQRTAAKADSPYAVPKFDPPEKFTIFWRLNHKATATITDYAEMTLFQEYKKRFGFDFEFHHPALDQHEAGFNLMRASGDFPDFVYWEGWTNIANGVESAFREGLAVDITDYVTPHNSPHFTKILQEDPSIRKHVVTDSGRFYGYPLLRYKQPMQGVWGFMLREDWLHKVGMRVEDIKSTDDLHRVLTLFKNSNINGDGRTVYPWMAKNREGGELRRAVLMWGISFGFYPKNGKIHYGPFDPEYRDAITTLARWYNEGLIDPDFATTDLKAGDAMMLNGTSGFYWGETGGISAMYMTTWRDSNPQAKVVGISTPTATRDGIHYTNSNDILYNGVALAISKTNKFPVESVRFMDWGYSHEGELLQNFGPEGITYTMVNGRPKLTDYVTNNQNGLSIDNAIARHALGSMQGPFIFNYDIREQRMLFFDWQRESVSRWNLMTDIQMPFVTPTQEESRRVSQIMADITTYSNEMFERFIMGREALSNFDAYYANLRRMGIEEAINIWQAAYDRWDRR